MAGNGLPIYYKNSKLVGPQSTRKKWKEYYLLVCTVVGFIILIAGVLWFVPSVEEDKSYNKAYSSFTGPSLGGITDSSDNPEPVGQAASPLDKEHLLKRDADSVPEIDPRQRKLEEDRREPIPVPGRGRPNNIEGGVPLEQRREENDIIVQKEEEHREERENYGEDVNQKQENNVADEVQSKDGEGGKKDAAVEEPELVEEEQEDPVTKQRREKIVEMAKHSWDGYVKYAWGDNELKPVSKRGHSAAIFGKNTKMGATIVDSLDTLYMMGMMDGFNKAKDWVKLSLNINEIKTEVSVFEFNIRFIGGLLSAYSLSGDELFKQKAVEIADKLLPVFNTPSGIPKSLINPATGAIKNWGWASGGSSVLAEFGSLHLEFQYLTHLTGNPIYLEKVNHVRQHLKKMTKPDGLYPNFLNPNTGNWGTKHISLGALGDSFYEYLLKSWLMTSKQDTEARDMYYESLSAIIKSLVKTTSKGLVYITDVKNGRPDNKMQHLACFSGGMLALGAQHAINGHSEDYMELAKQLANTCHESYQRTATKLGPEAFRFDANSNMNSRNNEKMYLLRPETVETYFILWRFTHDQKYRDWGWEVVQALEKHCRVESGGYTGIKDVYNANAPKDDVQQSFFIAETLKYLYLLYSDDNVIPLDRWFLNTEAHPFPIIPKIPTVERQDENAL